MQNPSVPRMRAYYVGIGGLLAVCAMVGMLGLLPAMGATDRYLPHGVCYRWQPDLIRLHLVSDVLIGLAYMAIPCTLVYFIHRRRDVPFNWMFLLFGLFIVSCGATHWMEVWTLWRPDYWLAGGVKAITAAASVPTAVLLSMLVPQALALPSNAQLREAKEALERQVRERERVEIELQRARDELEERVRTRTAELAAANAELERQREVLQQTDTAKNEFLAILSHELRNPIHAIDNNAWLIKSRSTDERLVRSSEAIARQVTSLSKLLEDLMEVVRVTRKADLDFSVIDLRDAVSAALETTESAIQANDMQLKVSMPASPMLVTGDATRLQQALGNLLHNAAKYSPPHTEIAVSVQALDGEGLITIRDQGIGIPSDELEDLFTLFTRGATARRYSQSGLGIGLHIARELIAGHGGHIEVHSEGSGHGAQFVVRLPLADIDRVRMPELAGSQPAQRKLSILVVDDNPDAADSLAEILIMQGHDAHAVYGGEEAVLLAASGQFEVALIDLGMPMVDGFDVVRQVLESPAGRRTVLVALTGWGEKADRERSREAGFSHHMTKPLDHGALAALLAEVGQGEMPG